MNASSMKTLSKFQMKFSCAGMARFKLTFAACFVLLTLSFSLKADQINWSDLSEQHVLVLGDSITYGGDYVAFLEAYLKLKFPEQNLDILNLGLPSETVSGLSEEGHAGGNFPRPDLHERLDRTL